MIQLIHTFFQSIAEFFSNIWNWITFAIGEVIDFFKLLGSMIAFVGSLLSFIPTPFIVFGGITIAILIIYLIIGRESGG